jgi:hypothetical protein
LSQVAKELVASFQPKVRTFRGQGRAPQSCFQMALRPSGALLAAAWKGRHFSSRPSRYADYVGRPSTLPSRQRRTSRNIDVL